MEKKRVLLVDDDNDLLDQYSLVLERNYDVIVARSGDEAFALIEGENPDVIVMDVMMDNVSDGLDTAKRMKRQGMLDSRHLVMLTGVNQHYDLSTQIDPEYFPNDMWLDKPVRPTALLKKINALVG